MKKQSLQLSGKIFTLIITSSLIPLMGFTDAHFDKKTVAIVETIRQEIPTENIHTVKENLRHSQMELSQRMLEIAEQQKQIEISLKKLAIAEQEQVIERILKKKLDLIQELNFTCDELLKNEQKYANISQQITLIEKELLKGQQNQARLIEDYTLLQENIR